MWQCLQTNPPSSLQTYIVPQASLFGDVNGNPDRLFNNIRVYGTILLLLLSLIVFVGVKIVSTNQQKCPGQP